MVDRISVSVSVRLRRGSHARWRTGGRSGDTPAAEPLGDFDRQRHRRLTIGEGPNASPGRASSHMTSTARVGDYSRVPHASRWLQLGQRSIPPSSRTRSSAGPDSKPFVGRVETDREPGLRPHKMAGGRDPARKRPGQTPRTSGCIISQVLVDEAAWPRPVPWTRRSAASTRAPRAGSRWQSSRRRPPLATRTWRICACV